MWGPVPGSWRIPIRSPSNRSASTRRKPCSAPPRKRAASPAPQSAANSVPIPARSFYFLRHGQTAWNVAGRFQGHSDIPLNELGLAQAYDAAKILANCPIDLIVVSPLIRARRTAEIVSEQLGKPLLLDDELKERHFGASEGLVVNEVKAELGLEP